ncbi:MAG: hypothetical protein COV48_16135, partial [Elusimicrobia bacterium CG11_big_fil_rev_8_21_14_0_20_64_6]
MRPPAAAAEGRSYLTCLIGLPPGGREHWTAALERSIRSRDAAGLRLAGRAFALLGRGPEAMSAFDRSLALDAASHEGWAWRGEALLLAGRRDEALRDFDRAAELSKTWPWARLLRAVCLLTEGDTDAAQKELAGMRALPEAVLVEALLEGQRGAARKGVRAATGELVLRPTGP